MDWFTEIGVRLVYGALNPFMDFLSDGGSRYFWVHCLAGLAIAAYGYRKHKASEGFRATLLDREVWLSKSAINDYIIAVINPMMRMTIFAWAAINSGAIADFVVVTLKDFGVSGTANDQTAWMFAILLTIALFVVDDFLRWYTHYLAHRIPELWEFHKVHHSAEVLNFATAERHHPLEIVYTSCVLMVGVGLVNGLFIAFFGDKLTPVTVAGANIFLVVFNLAGGVLRHSPFWIRFHPSVEKWFISPAMHQIHHSNKQEHFDRNMGGALAIWDRMAGTLHIPKGREIEGYGIGAETQDFRSLEVILLRPFDAAFRGLQKRFVRRFKRAAVSRAPVQS